MGRMANVLAFARDPTGTLQRIARDGGDVAFFRFGFDREVLISHPDLIEEVLVTRRRSFRKGRALEEARRVLGDGLLTAEGDVHLRHRRLVAPLFHQRAIRAYADDTVTLTERAKYGWEDGTALDLHRELMRLTLRIVSRTVFDLELDRDAHEVGAALTDVIEVLSSRMAIPFGSMLHRVPLPATRRFLRARARLDATIDAMLAERRRTGIGGGDLLSLLMAAEVAGGDGGGLTDREVRDEAMTILLAGHETTAVWLTWTVMALAQRPALADAVREEVRAVAGDRPVSFDDLPRLALTDRVLRESLRLTPPVWLIGRRALEDVEIGGHLIPTGTIVVLSQWVVHRDPRWHPHPERFDPDRWTADVAARLPRFAFFPFGGGVRRCIGEGFAWMEATLVLATLIRDRRFVLARDGPVRISPRITLRPRDGLPVVVHRV